MTKPTNPLELDHFWAWDTFVGPDVTVSQFIEQLVQTYVATLPLAHAMFAVDQLPELEHALLEHIAVHPPIEPDAPFTG